MASYKDFIGIDMGKVNFVVSSYGEKKSYTFPNSPEGFFSFEESFKERLPHAFIVLESTGGYERKLVFFLIERCYAVHRADTLKTKNFLSSLHHRTKTDEIDAQGLAIYAKERHGSLRIFNIFDENQEKLRQLVMRRCELIALRVQETNRLQSPGCEYVQDYFLINEINRQIEEIEKAIRSFIDDDPSFKEKEKILKGIDGIGEITAWSLLAFLPELGQCHRKEIASLAGLAPHPRDSGKKTGYRSIRGSGRFYVRQALFIAGLAISRCKTGSLKEALQRFLARGKQKKVTIMALARRIIVIANARLRPCS